MASLCVETEVNPLATNPTITSVMSCVPGRFYPANKNVLTHVSLDDGRVFTFEFGEDVSQVLIYRMLPVLLRKKLKEEAVIDDE